MKRQSGFKIMKRLITELKPLAPIMLITITLGVLGFLAAIAIGTFGAVALGTVLSEITWISFKGAIIVMIISAVLRGLLRYGEQLSGHYIAFKILYILRDKIFAKLRTLAPAKLEGKERGNLISLITSDIELLEVFYAHTVAPISIAVITNTIIACVLFSIDSLFGILAVVFYLIVGLIIPYTTSSMGKEAGVKYRDLFGECNNYILDSLRGLKEVLLFNDGAKRLNEINRKSEKINENLDEIKKHEGIIRALTDITIMAAIVAFTFIGIYKFQTGVLSFSEVLVSIVIIASSFGPVVALSNLSNTLLQTFACAERLFALMDEEPQVVENISGESCDSSEVKFSDVDFAYSGRSEKVLKATSIDIKAGDKIALVGKSGIGKSTFIKLMMRFWDPDKGNIQLSGKDLRDIKTSELRKSQTLVSQETYLFNESIKDNIAIGKKGASLEEVQEAAKKASIHDFICTLPNGYDTNAGELGGNLSAGERQRIGLARAFLNDGDVLILDEPTSNLDSLNEGEILKSIKENWTKKNIVLISHRISTTSICNRIFRLSDGKLIEEK